MFSNAKLRQPYTHCIVFRSYLSLQGRAHKKVNSMHNVRIIIELTMYLQFKRVVKERKNYLAGYSNDLKTFPGT